MAASLTGLASVRVPAQRTPVFFACLTQPAFADATAPPIVSRVRRLRAGERVPTASLVPRTRRRGAVGAAMIARAAPLQRAVGRAPRGKSVPPTPRRECVRVLGLRIASPAPPRPAVEPAPRARPARWIRRRGTAPAVKWIASRARRQPVVECVPAVKLVHPAPQGDALVPRRRASRARRRVAVYARQAKRASPMRPWDVPAPTSRAVAARPTRPAVELARFQASACRRTTVLPAAPVSDLHVDLTAALAVKSSPVPSRSPRRRIFSALPQRHPRPAWPFRRRRCQSRDDHRSRRVRCSPGTAARAVRTGSRP